nr:hypothetical protein [Tanacetum cinerariifolium]
VGVDAVEDFKEYMLRDYYSWLETYCCWYKLKRLDNAADSRLRLLEQSAAVDDKMIKYHYVLTEHEGGGIRSQGGIKPQG